MSDDEVAVNLPPILEGAEMAPPRALRPSINVSYAGGIDKEEDAAVKLLVGGESFGSGLGFGERDISFYADTVSDIEGVTEAAEACGYGVRLFGVYTEKEVEEQVARALYAAMPSYRRGLEEVAKWDELTDGQRSVRRGAARAAMAVCKRNATFKDTA